MKQRIVLLLLVAAVSGLLADHPRVRAARRAVVNTNVGHLRPTVRGADAAGT